MDTSLRLPPIGLDSAQSVRSPALAPPREREEIRALPPERQTPELPSARVDISPTAQAVARGDAPPIRPVETEPAIPVQTSEAVAQAGRAARDQDTSTAAGQEAVKRYLENAAANWLTGQAEPSAVRISA